MTRKAGPTISQGAHGSKIHDYTDHSAATVTNVTDSGGPTGSANPVHSSVSVGPMKDMPKGGVKTG